MMQEKRKAQQQAEETPEKIEERNRFHEKIRLKYEEVMALQELEEIAKQKEEDL